MLPNEWQTLQLFVKGISEKRGIEKNLWAKKFIKNILYSKSDIQVNLYYSTNYEKSDFSFLGGENTCPPKPRRRREKMQGKIPQEFSPNFSDLSVCSIQNGSPGRTRTSDMVVNSHPLCQLSYRGSCLLLPDCSIPAAPSWWLIPNAFGTLPTELPGIMSSTA